MKLMCARSGVLSVLLCVCFGHTIGQDRSAPTDSLLNVPYDDLVRDLDASNNAIRLAVARTQEQKNELLTAQLYHKLSIVQYLLGNVDSSTHYSILAAAVYRQENDLVRLGETLCMLGHQLKRTDLDQSFSYFREGIVLLESKNARQELTGSYDNFGSVHELANDLDSALFYFRKALALKEALNDSIGIPYSLNKIAIALLPEGRYDEAEQLVCRADSIRTLINDRMGLAEQPAYYGDVYKARGNYAEAIEAFRTALQLSEEVDFPYLGQYCYEQLADCYEATGDITNALMATKLAGAAKDSIRGERTQRTIVELKEKYNAAEKDRAISLLNAEAARRELYIWLVIIASALVVTVVLLVLQNRQRKHREQRDAAIIREREAGIRLVFEATEKERTRIARELHDGVGQQLGALKHRLEAIRNTAQVEEVIGIVDETSSEVRSIAHQMMPSALTRSGLVPAIEELLQRTFQGDGTSVTFEHLRVPEKLPMDIGTGVYRIVQELITNCLKHANATTVDVQIMGDGERLMIMVQDDGSGFDQAQDGKGIGLRNIRDRVRAMKGTFTVETSEGTGTLSTIRISLN